MTLTFGVDALCHACKGTGKNRDDLDCLACGGARLDRGLQAMSRRSDPATSHAAAKSVDHIRHSQALILDLLKEAGPMTDERIWTFHRITRAMSQSGARTRRSELVRLGLVVDSGKREKTAANRDSIVWAATK